MYNKNFKGEITAQKPEVQSLFNLVAGKAKNIKILNNNVTQPEIISDLVVVRDLLYVPGPADVPGDTLIFNLSYTYGKVRFQNGLDGKTIRWFIDGEEQIPFICESEDQYGIIAQGLREVAEKFNI